MGKVVGLIGSASGKVGNIVYAVSNGIQIARVYQPTVSNPKSALQNAQRAKGNLAGRISSFTPRTAIMGLGANNRIRRGEYLRQLLKAATVTTLNNQYTAKIDDNDIIFSKGSVIAPFTLSSITNSGVIISVTLTGISAANYPTADYTSKTARIVAMVYDLTSQELVEIATRIITKPAQGETAATNITVAHQQGYTAVVYLIPMSTEDGSAVTITTDMATLEDSAIQALLSVNSNAIVFNYGKSNMIGQTTFNPNA